MIKYCAVLLGFLLTPVFGQSENKAILKVGLVMPLSGSLGAYGRELVRGVEIAIADLQKTDPGVVSRIRLVQRDDESSTSKAEEVTRRLLEARGADLIFASLTSSTTLALAKVAREFGKPILSPAATNEVVTLSSPLSFRSCFIDSFQGQVLANFAVNEIRKSRAALLVEETSTYSKQIAAAFRKKFEALGGQVVIEQSYKTGEQDFRSLLTAIKSRRPQIVLAPGYYREVAAIIRQAKSIGLRSPFLGSDSWNTPKLYELTGKIAIRGHYFSSHFSLGDPDQKIKEFRAKYESRFNSTPGEYAAMGYDGLMVLAAVFRAADSNLSEDLVRSFNSFAGTEGLMGPIRFDGMRNATKAAAVVMTTADGNRFVSRIKL